MKKVTSIILIVLIFLISIMTLNLKAYSTNDFSIDIPSYYQYSGEDSFVSYEGNAIIIETNPFDTSEDFKYTQDNLNRLTSLIEESYQEYYGITSNIIDSQVVKFSENKYKGFYLRSSVTISGNNFFADQYIVVSGNYVYSLTIMTLNSTNYLNSEEAKSVVNSFTINNFEPIDNSISFLTVLKALAVIILLVLVVTFIIKTLDNKKDKEKINNDNVENNFNTDFLRKILITICGIAIIVFSVMSAVIYIYTIYYYSVDNGFWGAVYGMCLPGFSSLTLFFDLIGLEGFFNNFTIMVLVWLCSGLIFAVPVFFNKNN